MRVKVYCFVIVSAWLMSQTVHEREQHQQFTCNNCFYEQVYVYSSDSAALKTCSKRKQVAQLSQRDHAAVWRSYCGANINVVFRIQRTLL